MSIAVISADSVSSATWSEKERKKVVSVLTKYLKKIPDSQYEFFRGDSFQVVLKDPKIALNTALLLKTAVNSIEFSKSTDKEKHIQADIRLSIGIGHEHIKAKSLAHSDGTAYQLSGRRLDEMKKESRTLCISSENEEVTKEFEVSLLFLEEVFKRWSIASAEAVHYLLQGFTEVQLAKKVGVSQAAVNHRKKAASWHAIEALLKRYEQVALN